MRLAAALLAALPASAGVIRDFPDLGASTYAAPPPVDASMARAAVSVLTLSASVEGTLHLDNGQVAFMLRTLTQALAQPELAPAIQADMGLIQRALEISAPIHMERHPLAVQEALTFLTMTGIDSQQERLQFLERLRLADQDADAAFDGSRRRPASSTALVPAGDGPYRGTAAGDEEPMTVKQAIRLVKSEKTPEDRLSRALTTIDNALSYEKKRGRILNDPKLGRSLQALFEEFPLTHPVGEKVRNLLIKAREAGREVNRPRRTMQSRLDDATIAATRRVGVPGSITLVFVLIGMTVAWGAASLLVKLGSVPASAWRALFPRPRRAPLLEGARHAVKALPPPEIEEK
jgi:hypothetical protein